MLLQLLLKARVSKDDNGHSVCIKKDNGDADKVHVTFILIIMIMIMIVTMIITLAIVFTHAYISL